MSGRTAIDLLRLTRPLNLAIIALTMLVLREGLLKGLLGRVGLSLRMDGTDFLLLVLSTVLIAAAGNIINDYFDTRIDRINKPGKVIVGRTVKRRVAMGAHLTLSGIGLLIGTYVAWHQGHLRWAIIPAFAVLALWTYSTRYKRRLILGNLIVALLTGLVPVLVGAYEVPLRAQLEVEIPVGAPGAEVIHGFFRMVWGAVLVYAVFAFLSTLVRELQKDMADVKGDAADGCRTVPIVMGMGWARTFVIVHILAMVAGLLVIRRAVLTDAFSFWYLGLGIMAPLLLSGGLTAMARTRTGHLWAGHVMKLAMLMAVLFALFTSRVLA